MSAEAGATQRDSYRLLLAGVPDFRWLWASRAISNLGDATHLVALLWLASSAPTPGLWVGAIAFAMIGPGVAVGPFVGPLADRVNRRALLLACDGGRIVTAASVPFAFNAGGFAAVLPVVVIHSLFATLFGAAYAASFPDVVGTHRLLRANGLNAATGHVAMVAGSVLGGILISGPSVYPPFLIDAATFAASAAFLIQVDAGRMGTSASARVARYRDSLRDGFRYVSAHQRVRRLTIIGTVGTVGFAPAIVALVVLANEVLDVGGAEYGALQALVTVGIAAGGITIGRLPLAVPRQKVMAMGAGYLGMAAATLLLGMSMSFWLAAVFVPLRSFFNSVISVPSLTLFQEAVPSEFRARAYTLMTAVTEVPRALILPLAGATAAIVGVRALYFAMALAIAAAGLIAVRSRGAFEPAPAP